MTNPLCLDSYFNHMMCLHIKLIRIAEMQTYLCDFKFLQNEEYFYLLILCLILAKTIF